MHNEMAVRQIMRTPNVLGLVQCARTGEVLVREGAELNSLETVLGQFMRVAPLIEASGGGGFHQAQLGDKPLTALCMSHQGGAVCVVMDARASVAEVALQVRRAIDAPPS